jgi:hypothetical protein
MVELFCVLYRKSLSSDYVHKCFQYYEKHKAVSLARLSTKKLGGISHIYKCVGIVKDNVFYNLNEIELATYINGQHIY